MPRLIAVLAWPFYRPAPPGWKRHVAGVLMAAASVVLGACLFDLFGQAARTNLRLDTHTRTSVHEALALSFCGKYGVVGPQFSYDDPAGDAELLGNQDASARIPFSLLITTKYGSLERYCALSVDRVLNNENSLFLLMAAVLSFPPDDTPATLRIKVTAFSSALIFAVLYMLAVLGVGIIPLLLIGLVACRAVELVQHTHVASIYSVMPVLLLVGGAGIAMLVRILEQGRTAIVLAAGLGFGLVWAVIYNFRTSYGLAAAGQLLVALAVLGWKRRRVIGFGKLLAAAAVGFVIFQAALIWPLERASTFNEAKHGIWHPLVIGASIPMTPFSEREGIRWDDNIAYALAQRVDPAVKYLGPGYEAALRTYYFQLWRDHAAEMRRVYRLKIHALGGVVEALVGAFFQRPMLTRISAAAIPRGSAWFSYLLAITLLFFFGYRFSAPICIAGIAFAAAVFCVSVEQAAITPVFIMIYQASLVVCTAAMLAMLSVLAAAALTARLRRPEVVR
jgi:hypothetical protein